MKVYIVEVYHEYSHSSPEAVFDSREKAEAFIKSEGYYIEPDIIELELK